MRDLWEQAPRADVLSIAVRLEDLCPRDTQLPLFEGERHRRDLMAAMDRINARGGADTVCLARMHGEWGTAPRRIPFGKPPELGQAYVEE